MLPYQTVPEIEPVEGVAGVPVVRDLVLPNEANRGNHGSKRGPGK